jgi:hypothetical protein
MRVAILGACASGGLTSTRTAASLSFTAIVCPERYEVDDGVV